MDSASTVPKVMYFRLRSDSGNRVLIDRTCDYRRKLRLVHFELPVQFQRGSMRVQTVGTLAVLFCTLNLLASPQDQEKGPAVANKHLQVFFSELETQLLKAVQDKSPAALNGIVSDDFQVWTASPPGNPISRSEWLLGIFGRRLLSFNVRQLSVHQLTPEIAVVSFVQTETYKQSATPQTEDHFVIDVWITKGTGDNWRCTDRYVSVVAEIPAKK